MMIRANLAVSRQSPLRTLSVRNNTVPQSYQDLFSRSKIILFAKVSNFRDNFFYREMILPRCRIGSCSNSGSSNNRGFIVVSCILFVVLCLCGSTTIARADAFSPITNNNNPIRGTNVRSISNTSNNSRRRPNCISRSSRPLVFTGGGGTATTTTTGPLGMSSAAAAASDGGGKAKTTKKARIHAFDSMRFFMVAYICIGHFVRFANPSEFVMRFFVQVNVVVGAFFVLSGYVAAYTSTEVATNESSPKLNNSPAWIMARIFGYYPLHLVCLLLFLPVFLYADVSYNGWWAAIGHGVMSLTMTQAWFPMHAEAWNAPTWFLSALTFATITLPFAIPRIANMNKAELRRTLSYLFAASLLPKLGYSHDHDAWSVMEGMLAPKQFANLAIFNTQRFNPFYATVEVLIGVVACRLVMLDEARPPNDDTDEKVGHKKKKLNANVFSTLLPLLGMVGVLELRALDILRLNDMLTRTVVFLPLFVKFLVSVHRASVVAGNITDPLVRVLSHPWLAALGGLAFPIFVVHGPIGQIFYKRIVAQKLFGGTLHALYGAKAFYGYLAVVVLAAGVLKSVVVDNPAMTAWSRTTATKLSDRL